jgi:hypothetical protein
MFENPQSQSRTTRADSPEAGGRRSGVGRRVHF